MKRGGKKKKRGKNKLVGKKKGDIRLPNETTIFDKQSGKTIIIHELVGRVIKKLGGGKGSAHVLVKCHNGKEYKVRIPGKWHKRVWINNDDLLLVGYVDDMENNVEAIIKYDDSRNISVLKKQPWYSKLFDETNEQVEGFTIGDDDLEDNNDNFNEIDEDINLDDFKDLDSDDENNKKNSSDINFDDI